MKHLIEFKWCLAHEGGRSETCKAEYVVGVFCFVHRGIVRPFLLIGIHFDPFPKCDRTCAVNHSFGHDGQFLHNIWQWIQGDVPATFLPISKTVIIRCISFVANDVEFTIIFNELITVIVNSVAIIMNCFVFLIDCRFECVHVSLRVLGINQSVD